MSINLVAERLNRGQSTRAAAEAIGVSRGTLERAERGERPQPELAKKIADHYGVKVTDIWPIEPTNGTPVAA